MDHEAGARPVAPGAGARDSRARQPGSTNGPARQQGGRVLLAVLTERVSGRGQRYLAGWLGASNLIGFEGEPDGQGRATWNVFLTERQPPMGDR